MKKLLIENLSDQITLMQKADFEAVDAVFNALDFAFHPNGFDDDGPDDRFLSLWRLFLISVGWNEDDYWMEVDFRSHHKCDKCLEKEKAEKSTEDSSDKETN